MRDPDTILLETEESMQKALDYLKHEFQGVRTGRATTALVDYLKVDCYGSTADLKSLAAVSVPEATQILIKPFDAGLVGAIKQAIEAAQLGFNPIVEGKQLRIKVPALSQDTRKKLVARVEKMAEEQKVAIRNVRRDANKHADDLSKQAGTHFSEDEIKTLKEEVQSLLKKFEDEIVKRSEEKIKEIMTL